jgi:hypothetical protein
MEGLTPSMTHWMTEHSFRTEQQAEEARDALVTAFLEYLRSQKGVTEYTAPLMPSSSEWQIELRRGCRVITGWIPDWLPVANAGKFVVRLDVLAPKADA